jgi:hypothetical protein
MCGTDPGVPEDEQQMLRGRRELIGLANALSSVAAVG